MDRDTLDAMQMSAPEESDALKEACSVLGQRLVVRGTNEDFPDDGPNSVYAALFDPRPCFDKLRYSVVVEGDDAQIQETIARLLSRCQPHEPMYGIVQEVYRRLETLMEARCNRVDIPENFVRDAWPAYIAACTDSN